MEVLSYVKNTPAIALIPILFIAFGAGGLIGALLWAYSEDEWTDAMTIAIAIVSCLVLVCGIIWASKISPNVYIFARITDEKSFTEMVKDYEFIEEVAGIYKLRLK